MKSVTAHLIVRSLCFSIVFLYPRLDVVHVLGIVCEEILDELILVS